jgi:hypothetical protein
VKDPGREVRIIPSLSDVFKEDERFDGWPSLQVHVEFAPWYWRVGWYSCREDGHFLILWLGPVQVHLWA